MSRQRNNLERLDNQRNKINQDINQVKYLINEQETELQSCEITMRNLTKESNECKVEIQKFDELIYHKVYTSTIDYQKSLGRYLANHFM